MVTCSVSWVMLQQMAILDFNGRPRVANEGFICLNARGKHLLIYLCRVLVKKHKRSCWMRADLQRLKGMFSPVWMWSAGWSCVLDYLCTERLMCVFLCRSVSPSVGVCRSDHVTSHTYTQTHVLSFFCKLYSAVPLCTIPSQVLAVIIQISVSQDYNM